MLSGKIPEVKDSFMIRQSGREVGRLIIFNNLIGTHKAQQPCLPVKNLLELQFLQG